MTRCVPMNECLKVLGFELAGGVMAGYSDQTGDFYGHSGSFDLAAVNMSVFEVSQSLRRRTFSCREYTENLIACCEANAGLNPFVSHDWDRLLEDADAVDGQGTAGSGLHGIPLAFKDNINTKRLSTGASTPSLKGFYPSSNAPVASRLFDSGVLLGAKANMHELALGITTNNTYTGPSRNPYDPAMIPGGSSGGTAAAVAARMMPAGIGTDTGGSVRIPAALCGIVGFRPSVGRYPREGLIPVSRTHDTAGPMARCVTDIRILDAVMAQVEQSSRQIPPSQIRLGVPRQQFYHNLEADVASATDCLLGLLSDEGVILVEVDIPGLAELSASTGVPVVLFEFVRELALFLDHHNAGVSVYDLFEAVASPDVKSVLSSQMGKKAVHEAEYRRALDEDRPLLQEAYASCFKEHRLNGLIFPTVPLSARPVGDDERIELNGQRAPTFATYIRNTESGSNAGLPGISLPIGLTAAGLPIGIEIDGPFGSDESVLAMATTIEQVVNFDSRPKSLQSVSKRRT